MAKNEWHVCSLIVQIVLDKLITVQSKLSAMLDTDVVGNDPVKGKLVIVMQADDADLLFEKIESVLHLNGVLAVLLVYHQQDDHDDEEM